jgi:hypothetical protein
MIIVCKQVVHATCILGKKIGAAFFSLSRTFTICLHSRWFVSLMMSLFNYVGTMVSFFFFFVGYLIPIDIELASLLCVLSSKTILSNPIDIAIIKRTMFGRFASRVAKNMPKDTPPPTVLSSLPASPGDNKTYATTNVREHDSNCPDPLGPVNNPPIGKKKIVHPEIQRGTCDKVDCKGKDCGPLPTPTATSAPCGETVKKFEGVAHLTSGNPSVPQGKVVNLDPTTNAVGALKMQNAVFYDNPHNTSPTPESFPIQGQATGKGTDYIHDQKNPHRIATIVNETKNK